MTENSLSRFDQLRAELKAKREARKAKRLELGLKEVGTTHLNASISNFGVGRVYKAPGGAVKAEGHPVGETSLLGVPRPEISKILATQAENKAAKRLNRKNRRKDLESLAMASGKKKLKLLSVRRAKQVLWGIIAEIVKIQTRRVTDFCLTCGQRPITEACHIIPKSESLNTAFDLDNLYGGCNFCNRSELRYRGKWARIIFPQVFGPEKITMLNERSKIKVKWDQVDFAEKIAQARTLLASLKQSKEAP